MLDETDQQIDKSGQSVTTISNKLLKLRKRNLYLTHLKTKVSQFINLTQCQTDRVVASMRCYHDYLKMLIN